MTYNWAFAGDGEGGRGKGAGCLRGLSAALGRTAHGWSCLSWCFPVGCWWCCSSWCLQGCLLTIQLVSALIPFAAFPINLESKPSELLSAIHSVMRLCYLDPNWTLCKAEHCMLIAKSMLVVCSSVAEMQRLNHSSLCSPSSLPSLLCHVTFLLAVIFSSSLIG